MRYSTSPNPRKWRGLVALCLNLVWLLSLPGAPAPAIYADATIVVNTTSDPDFPGDGFCTLRNAIDNANKDLDVTGGDCAAGSGADTITVSVTGIISLTLVPDTLQTALPPITSTMTIRGPGASKLTVRVLDNNVGVFAVSSSGSLTLQDLVKQHHTGAQCEYRTGRQRRQPYDPGDARRRQKRHHDDHRAGERRPWRHGPGHVCADRHRAADQGLSAACQAIAQELPLVSYTKLNRSQVAGHMQKRPATCDLRPVYATAHHFSQRITSSSGLRPPGRGAAGGWAG